MNPVTVQQAVRLAREIVRRTRGIRNVEVVIAPPSVFLSDVKGQLSNVELGAQDVFWEKSGAYTGEISPSMLKSSRVKYVIVGHSERRALGETERQINKKMKAVLKTGLKVILCVGEPWEVRKKGFIAAKNFVRNQLRKDLKGIGNWKLPLGPELGIEGEIGNLLIAYEPIWAIGTGRSDKPKDTVEMIRFIKKTLYPNPYTLTPKVLYGGSVTAKNAKSFLEQEEIGGALVGGASLRAGEFGKIVKIASRF